MLPWLFPVTCVRCGERSELALCPACRATLTRVPTPICLYCGAPQTGIPEDPHHCAQCKAKPRSFSFARSALMQDEDTLALVHDLKYHRANYLAPAFASLIAELWETTPELRAHNDWHLVPVPVSAKHLRQRGYNQTEELAICLAKLLHLRVWDPLERLNTGIESQTKLTASQRQQHALRAYALRRRFREKPAPSPHLLIIDDVYTTGSTVRACARALAHLPGVRQAGVVTLLRAGRNPAAPAISPSQTLP